MRKISRKFKSSFLKEGISNRKVLTLIFKNTRLSIKSLNELDLKRRKNKNYLNLKKKMNCLKRRKHIHDLCD